MSFAEFLFRLFSALALGALVGAERQRRNPLAGMRTNALVSLGAAMFVMISHLVAGGNAFDPTRVAAQVVSGIGFLGAGVILREGLNVRGLNTAATMWAVAAVGSLAGLGLLREAASGALAILFVNLVVRRLARFLEGPGRGRGNSELEVVYSLEAVCRPEDEAHVRVLLVQALMNSPLHLRLLETSDLEPGRLHLRAELAGAGHQERVLEEVAGRLSIEQGVSAVRWRVLDGEIG